MALTEPLVWIKDGDCLAEVGRLCQRCQRETGARGVSEKVQGRLIRTGDRVVTMLVAEGAWWEDLMRVHPNGWTGGTPVDEVIRRGGL